MFEHLKAEMEWRERERRGVGYESLSRTKPVLAIGATRPMSAISPLSDGASSGPPLGDGLSATPSSEEIWQSVDTQRGPSSAEDKIFHRSVTPGHEEILRVLREEDPGTVTIVALAPLTTVARAAEADPETFLRVEEVVVLGGSMNASDIVSMASESNTYQDPLAATNLFAQTTPVPGSAKLQGVDYPGYLPTRLMLLLFPLESTNDFFVEQWSSDGATVSPLEQWLGTVLAPTFIDGKARLRAPVLTWYATTPYDWEWMLSKTLDIRVEHTEPRGLCIIDGSNIKDESKGMYEEGRWVDSSLGTRLQVVTNDCANVYQIILYGGIFGSDQLDEE